MLIENTLFGIEDKVKIATAILKNFEPPEGYYVAFSGGKDSVVIKNLCYKAGVKFDVHYTNPTIDPPELIAFIRRHHPDVIMHYPKESFFKLIVQNGFPRRQVRWCCEVFKEYGGSDRIVITGVRRDESTRRKARRQFEFCNRKKYEGKRFLHIILDWSVTDVWEYIKLEELPYCSLYDEGFTRIGCIGCPMAYWRQRVRELERYPRIERLYRKAFNELYDKRKADGYKSVDRWQSGDEMFDWWITNQEPNDNLPLFA